MQVDTGNLVDMREAAVEKIQELYKKGYEPVPDELRSVAGHLVDMRVPFFMKQMSGRQPIPEYLKVREFPGK